MFQRKAISIIFNVIEDAYIEAAEVSVYDNIEHYLKFGHAANLVAQHNEIGTATKRFSKAVKTIDKKTGEVKTEFVFDEKAQMFVSCIDYIAGILISPFVEMCAKNFGTSSSDNLISKGQEVIVTRRLFTNLEGSSLIQNDTTQMLFLRDISEFEIEKEECLMLILYNGFCFKKTLQVLEHLPFTKE